MGHETMPCDPLLRMKGRVHRVDGIMGRGTARALCDIPPLAPGPPPKARGHHAELAPHRHPLSLPHRLQRIEPHRPTQEKASPAFCPPHMRKAPGREPCHTEAPCLLCCTMSVKTAVA